MRRLPLVSLFALATVMPAAEPVASDNAAATSPVFVAPAEPGTRADNVANPTRRVSPSATRLAATAPKYVVPSTDVPSPAEAVLDARELDPPRNGIVRLPRYLVEEPRVPLLKERDVLTEYGKLDLALKRHPGLRIGSWGIFNNNFWAREMIEEEFALERQREMAALLSLLPTSISPSPTTSVFSLVPTSTFSAPWRSRVVPWERR